jgi:hypothetical protein
MSMPAGRTCPTDYLAAFATYADAANANQSLRARHKPPGEPYRCQTGGHWHLSMANATPTGKHRSTGAKRGRRHHRGGKHS